MVLIIYFIILEYISYILLLWFYIHVLVSYIFNCRSLVLFRFSQWNKYNFSNTKCSRSVPRIADRTRPQGLELSIMAGLPLPRSPHLAWFPALVPMPWNHVTIEWDLPPRVYRSGNELFPRISCMRRRLNMRRFRTSAIFDLKGTNDKTLQIGKFHVHRQLWTWFFYIDPT